MIQLLFTSLEMEDSSISCGFGGGSQRGLSYDLKLYYDFRSSTVDGKGNGCGRAEGKGQNDRRRDPGKRSYGSGGGMASGYGTAWVDKTQ